MTRLVKERNDIKPIIVKFGVALAVSFASFLYYKFKSRIVPPPTPQSPRSSDCGNEIESRPKDETENKMTRPTSYAVASIPSQKYEVAILQKVGSDKSASQLSPRSKLISEKETFLLPEFDDLTKEFDAFSPEALDIPDSDSKPTKVYIGTQKNVSGDEEISTLQETVRILRERERKLEDQLLEFYGLKEQQSTVMELQNRLKLNNMEAKLFSIKIESLKTENQKLREQVTDRVKVLADLDAARDKIRFLKQKLRFEAEQNKEQILKLQERVMKFQDEEVRSLSSCSEVQSKLKRVGELEREIEELRKSNSMLEMENSELTRTLESTQILANSVLEDSETNALRETSDRLRQENGYLQQEIEQLKADRCSEVEELVYLRWINACLRYELRDYHPQSGKTVVARDLSKTLSPKSEEKAKQLILEYANSEGINENEINFMDLLESDRWSDSHTSFTDSAELDESSLDNSSTAKTNSSSKKKFLSKLRKLICKPEFVEESADSIRNNSIFSTGGSLVAENEKRFRHSVDVLPSSKSAKEGRVSDVEMGQRNSDVGPSRVYKSYVLGRECVNELNIKDEIEKQSGSAERSELLKYAEALKRSRRGSLNLHRKSASYSSFLHH